MELFANRSKDELITRLYKHKEEFDAGDIVPKSPEGRDGQERQVRPGAAAAKLRAEATKDAPLHSPELDDDSFADTAVPWTNILPAPLPPNRDLRSDPLPDPWKAYIGTPHATRRSAGAHSGLTPLLNRNRQSLEAFLADTSGPSLAPFAAIPPPQHTDGPDAVLQALLRGQNALLEGVNEMRANMVTTQTLAKFHELQAREMQTYVQAELLPLHHGLGEVVRTVNEASAASSNQAARIAVLESQVGDARPEPHDPNRRRIAFIGFQTNTSADSRLAAMENFMKQHFPTVRPMCVNLFSDKGSYSPSIHGFVELATPQQARAVADAIRTQNLQVADHPGVRVKIALTDIDKNRNWALKVAEEQIKASNLSIGKTVTVKKGGGKGIERGVYVNDALAFTQAQRFAKDGIFIRDNAHLKLP